MTEIVKVFKNVHTQTAVGAAHSITLASTGATEKAVIKEVNCKNVINATLDLDGRTIATSTQDMIASGSLIMDNNSTLSLKFPDLATFSQGDFEGMFFSDGTDSIVYFEGDGKGDGLDTSMTSVTSNQTNGSHNAYSSFTAMKNGIRTFFRYYSNNIYEYEATSTAAITNAAFGSGYGACTDGTYMYNIPSSTTSTINRRHIDSGVDSNFTSNTAVQGQGANQGSFLIHHDGYLYSKYQGSSTTMYIIKISDGSVTTVTNGTLNGGYSDGGCIVTRRVGSHAGAGKSYVVEQSTNEWQWYEIGGTENKFTKASGKSEASTEYGNGAIEVAPGVAAIFTEKDDDLIFIDMNTTPPTWEKVTSPSTRKMGVSNAHGSYFSVCGVLTPHVDDEIVNYDAYTSGVLITENT